MRSIFLFSLSMFWLAGNAQDTLPRFSARLVRGDKVIIGWVNPYPNMSQISIQRSHDSLKNYRTVLTIADPRAVQNGWVDPAPPNDHMYYRIFYALEGGAFFFSAAKRPYRDTSSFPLDRGDLSNPGNEISEDSLSVVMAPNKKPPPSYVPSSLVYTLRDGYLHLHLPGAAKRDYNLKFYDGNEEFLFEMKGIRDEKLKLDKAAFLQSGWYFFELRDGNALVEKHKFYLTRDF